jgi:hypothetical protein
MCYNMLKTNSLPGALFLATAIESAAKKAAFSG